MSSDPAGTSSRPEGEPSVNGATRGTANPGPGGIANPGPGSEMLEGTRGAEGPGRPPRKVPRSDGAPPRVPPEPGKGPRLVEPRTRVVSRGSIVGFWATTAGTSRPKAIKIPGPHPATRRIMDPAPLPGNGSADASRDTMAPLAPPPALLDASSERSVETVSNFDRNWHPRPAVPVKSSGSGSHRIRRGRPSSVLTGTQRSVNGRPGHACLVTQVRAGIGSRRDASRSSAVPFDNHVLTFAKKERVAPLFGKLVARIGEISTIPWPVAFAKRPVPPVIKRAAVAVLL